MRKQLERTMAAQPALRARLLPLCEPVAVAVAQHLLTACISTAAVKFLRGESRELARAAVEICEELVASEAFAKLRLWLEGAVLANAKGGGSGGSGDDLLSEARAHFGAVVETLSGCAESRGAQLSAGALSEKMMDVERRLVDIAGLGIAVAKAAKVLTDDAASPETVGEQVVTALCSGLELLLTEVLGIAPAKARRATELLAQSGAPVLKQVLSAVRGASGGSAPAGTSLLVSAVSLAMSQGLVRSVITKLALSSCGEDESARAAAVSVLAAADFGRLEAWVAGKVQQSEEATGAELKAVLHELGEAVMDGLLRAGLQSRIAEKIQAGLRDLEAVLQQIASAIHELAGPDGVDLSALLRLGVFAIFTRVFGADAETGLAAAELASVHPRELSAGISASAGGGADSVTEVLEANPSLRKLLREARRKAERLLIEDCKLPRVVAETLVEMLWSGELLRPFLAEEQTSALDILRCILGGIVRILFGLNAENMVQPSDTGTYSVQF